jgi:hypothetical protein
MGASLQGGRSVVGRTLCSQGKYFLNRHSLGHLLIAVAVLWDVRCVLKGSIFKTHSLGVSLQGGRCVAGRTLGSRGKYFSNRLSLGHLLMEDAV